MKRKISSVMCVLLYADADLQKECLTSLLFLLFVVVVIKGM
jgi:hypothetical protein